MKRYIVYNCICRPAGGLADRLKGIVSCYALAKKLNRDFIINWSYPYDISEALEVNKVNWKKRQIEGTAEEHFIFDCEGHRSYETAFNFPENIFKNDIVCIKTNINFTKHFPYNFSSLFEELFKLKLEMPFDIDSNTVGVCARFGGKDCNWSDINFNRELTFDYVLDKTKELAAGRKIFLCSDSDNFYNFAKDKLDFISIPGSTEHMDRDGCSLYGFKKSFLDFYSLRKCGLIISTKGEFAKTAALSVGKEVIDL